MTAAMSWEIMPNIIEECVVGPCGGDEKYWLAYIIKAAFGGM